MEITIELPRTPHAVTATLIETCGACPEAYDVHVEGEQIGHLRLRYGTFRAWYPDIALSGEVVYEARPEGDGVFVATERDHYLREGVQALVERMIANRIQDQVDPLESEW